MSEQPGRRRAQLQRGIIILPSAFTLANLFFGFYAIVAATRGEMLQACWFIILASVLDMLDGRVARFTRTGSTFGEELDSLVDAISFGVAPAFIMYTLYFSDANWSWTLPFTYVTAVVVRLARFNVEQGGAAKTQFNGLPSTTAGMILAAYYPFSQTPFFQDYMAGMPWPRIMGVVMIMLSALMLSHVPYPVMPRISFKTRKGVLTTTWLFGNVVAAITIPRYYFFPMLVMYTAWGLTRSVIAGLLERLPDRDPLLDAEIPEEADEVRTLDYGDLTPGPFNPDARHPENDN